MPQSGPALVRARPMPVGSVSFRDHAQDPQRSLGHVLFLFPCSQARGLCGTPKGTMLGMKSRFLLSEATTGNKLEKHPTYKSNLFPAPHSLPFSSVRGTDIPNSQYKYIPRFHYSTNMGQAQGGRAQRKAERLTSRESAQRSLL